MENKTFFKFDDNGRIYFGKQVKEFFPNTEGLKAVMWENCFTIYDDESYKMFESVELLKMQDYPNAYRILAKVTFPVRVDKQKRLCFPASRIPSSWIDESFCLLPIISEIPRMELISKKVYEQEIAPHLGENGGLKNIDKGGK